MHRGQESLTYFPLLDSPTESLIISLTVILVVVSCFPCVDFSKMSDEELGKTIRLCSSYGNP